MAKPSSSVREDGSQSLGSTRKAPGTDRYRKPRKRGSETGALTIEGTVGCKVRHFVVGIIPASSAGVSSCRLQRCICCYIHGLHFVLPYRTTVRLLHSTGKAAVFFMKQETSVANLSRALILPTQQSEGESVLKSLVTRIDTGII